MKTIKLVGKCPIAIYLFIIPETKLLSLSIKGGVVKLSGRGDGEIDLYTGDEKMAKEYFVEADKKLTDLLYNPDTHLVTLHIVQ